MWSWFGGAGGKRKNEPKDAIINLRSQLEMLQKRERHLEMQIAEQDGVARKNVSTNKNSELPCFVTPHQAMRIAQIILDCIYLFRLGQPYDSIGSNLC